MGEKSTIAGICYRSAPPVVVSAALNAPTDSTAAAVVPKVITEATVIFGCTIAGWAAILTAVFVIVQFGFYLYDKFKKCTHDGDDHAG